MGSNSKILVVDDDKGVLNSIKNILTVRDYTVGLSESGEDALTMMDKVEYDVVVTDLMMKGMSGMELLKEIKVIHPDTIVILITAHAAVDNAIEAIRLGAYDYVPKPFNDEELIIRIERGIENKLVKEDRESLRRYVEEKYSFDNILAKDPSMLAIFDRIIDIAETDATVLIYGETGTGKELIAKSIHFRSHRKNAPFVAVHCAALSETLLESELFGHEKGAFTGAFKQKKGRFEQANGGTIFFDEVGDIPLVTQVKLLRALQEKEYERVGGTETLKTDMRIIAATNKDLKSPIKEGLFREDLFYRLNVFPITLPPLRDRKGDIPLLVQHIIKKLNTKLGKDVEGVTESVLANLLDYGWPGNIRELENILERAVLVTKGELIEHVELETLHKNKTAIGLQEAMEIENYEEFQKRVIDPVEKQYIEGILMKYNGDIETVISKMGVSQRTLYNRAKEYGINFKKYLK